MFAWPCVPRKSIRRTVDLVGERAAHGGGVDVDHAQQPTRPRSGSGVEKIKGRSSLRHRSPRRQRDRRPVSRPRRWPSSSVPPAARSRAVRRARGRCRGGPARRIGRMVRLAAASWCSSSPGPLSTTAQATEPAPVPDSVDPRGRPAASRVRRGRRRCRAAGRPPGAGEPMVLRPAVLDACRSGRAADRQRRPAASRIHHLVEPDRRRDRLDLVGRDGPLRSGELDEPEQQVGELPCADRRLFESGAVVAGELVPVDQLEQAEHGVQRSRQFVAEFGEERLLGLAGHARRRSERSRSTVRSATRDSSS